LYNFFALVYLALLNSKTNAHCMVHVLLITIIIFYFSSTPICFEIAKLILPKKHAYLVAGCVEVFRSIKHLMKWN